MSYQQTAHGPEAHKKQRSKITWYKNTGSVVMITLPLVQTNPTLYSLSDLSSQLQPSRQSGNCPSRDQPVNPPQALYCLPRAPFGPVHFTEYPPNPAYSEYGLETILIANSLARTRETKYIGHKGKRIKIPPLLFKDKYNYLPAYFVPMTPPLTLRPNHLMEPNAAAETTSIQLFVVLYITFVEVLDVQAFWLPPTYLTSSHCLI
ncbi:hypothetical protein DSO57_1005946 [Entomophthora muscae]|uniref:Uncharacterized protein n=1 Tax=Entomophthora muscae TaxID=34485 RepID=A0ACC2TUR2_9FUNG|nr:hypothetical protein DSO57_1005946 [Entomophthora muscae]